MKMIVKANHKDEKYNYFIDKETKEKRVYGDVFECDDELAKERIKKKLVVKASKEEIEEFKKKTTPEKPLDGKTSNENLEKGTTSESGTDQISIEELKQMADEVGVEYTEETTYEELTDLVNKALEAQKSKEEIEE